MSSPFRTDCFIPRTHNGSAYRALVRERASHPISSTYVRVILACLMLVWPSFAHEMPTAVDAPTVTKCVGVPRDYTDGWIAGFAAGAFSVLLLVLFSLLPAYRVFVCCRCQRFLCCGVSTDVGIQAQPDVPADDDADIPLLLTPPPTDSLDDAERKRSPAVAELAQQPFEGRSVFRGDDLVIATGRTTPEIVAFQLSAD